MPKSVKKQEALPSAEYISSLIDGILQQAKDQGATGAEADVCCGTGLSVCIRQQAVDTIEHERDNHLELTVYLGQRKGNVSTSNIRPDGIKEIVTAACDIARHSSEDSAAKTADPEWMPQSMPDLDLDHPWPITPDEAAQIALAAEAGAIEHDTRIKNTEEASVNTYRQILFHGNTTGFSGYWYATRHMIDCQVIASDDSGMQQDGWYDVSCIADELPSPESIGREAARQAVARLSPRSLKSRRAPVLYAPWVAKSLFGSLISALSGHSLYTKSSCYLDAIDKNIMPDWANVQEQPLLPRAVHSAPFDGDGVATQPRHIVKDGVLCSYFLDSYSARRLNIRSTGNADGVHNLTVMPGNCDQAGLMKEMGRGLFVTDLMGSGGDPTTGHYSQGARGLWIEEGRPVFPVEGITIAGNLVDMMRNVLAFGNDMDRRSRVHCGSVLFDTMTIAGNE